MYESINIYDAKSRFSSILERAERGDEITIARAGRPIAKLIPYTEKSQRPRSEMFGSLKGKVIGTQDFETWPDEFWNFLKKPI